MLNMSIAMSMGNITATASRGASHIDMTDNYNDKSMNEKINLIDDLFGINIKDQVQQ